MMVDSTLVLILAIVGMPVLSIIMIFFIDSMSSKKATILFFESEKQARFMGKKVKDGVVKIGKKNFFVDKAVPPLVPGGILFRSFRPFYAFKWDKALPVHFSERGLKSISASNLKNLIENKTLDQLLTPKTTSKLPIIMFIMGTIMGGLVGYVLSLQA